MVCCAAENYYIKASKKSLFDSQFSVESNGFVLNFCKEHELAQQYQKANNTAKTQIYVFRGLRYKKVASKAEAFTGGVLLGAFKNFAKFTVEYLR